MEVERGGREDDDDDMDEVDGWRAGEVSRDWTGEDMAEGGADGVRGRWC